MTKPTASKKSKTNTQKNNVIELTIGVLALVLGISIHFIDLNSTNVTSIWHMLGLFGPSVVFFLAVIAILPIFELLKQKSMTINARSIGVACGVIAILALLV